jgi:ribose transport system permease protein
MRRTFSTPYLILAAFLVLLVITTILEPSFLTLDNITNIGRQMSLNAIISAGMTFVILTGGIDLSVGSILAFTGVLTAMMLKSDLPIPVAIIIGLFVGALAGGINGLLVALARIPPFIATLAMMVIARSATRIITGNVSVYGLPDGIRFLGRGIILGIPVPVLLIVLIYAGGFILLRDYRFGRYVYAIGGNEEAAHLSGIDIRVIKILVYMVAGILAALGGIVAVARVGAADPKLGEMFELDAIAAVVVGGTSLTGGRGHILATLLGVIIVSVLSNVLTLLNINPDYQGLVKGAVIIGAVLASRKP